MNDYQKMEPEVESELNEAKEKADVPSHNRGTLESANVVHFDDPQQAATNPCKMRESLGFFGILQLILWTLCLPVFALLIIPLCLCRILPPPARCFVTYSELFFCGSARKLYIAFSKLVCYPVYWRYTHFELPLNSMWTNDKSLGRVALTFDDAPSDPELMNSLLDILQEFDTKATFFVISDLIKMPGREAVMRRIVEDGHQLANHGVRDRPMVSYNKDRLERELLECEEAIVRFDPTFLSQTKLFRAPSGLMSRTMMRTLVQLGYKSVLTDCYTMDPRYCNDAKWHTGILCRLLRAGSIVLLHCPTKPGPRSRIQTLEITRSLLKDSKSLGIQFCSLAGVF